MALESFYGGKQGISPVIKARFKYVTAEQEKQEEQNDQKVYLDTAYGGRIGKTTRLTKEEAIWLTDSLGEVYQENQEIRWSEETLKPFTMDECLKDINYTDVWYGELCIIDTDNKMNPNNGKIYRRTLKQVDNKFVNTEDTRYAEYIGQIVGPSGGVPRFDFGSLDAEREKAIGARATYENEEPCLDNSAWEYAYKDNNGNISSAIPQKIEDIAISDSGDSVNIQMVPGKKSEKDENDNDVTVYNDKIRYTWCNVRRTLDGKDTDAWVYLGFEIPYTVFDVDVQKENYRYIGDYLIDNSTTPEIIDNDNLIPNPNYHPFSKYYTFHIPRGTRGIGPEEIFIVTPENKDDTLGSETILYDFDAIEYNQGTDTYSINLQKTKEFEDPNTEKTYWVAKWTLYNPENKLEPVIYQYLGSYKDIDKIEINTVQTDDNYGKVTVNYSNGEIKEIATLPLIKNVEYDPSNGFITFKHAGNYNITTTDAISYISKMQILNDGTIQYKFNTDKEEDNWKNITDFNNNPVKIKDIIETKIATVQNLSDFTNGKIGHLYIKYRPEPNTWVDLGQVVGNTIAGIVYTLPNNPNRTTDLDALNEISGATFNEDSSDSIGGNADGRIKANNKDVTGGLVAALIQDQDGSTHSAIFYYDPNDNGGIWKHAGNIGGNGTNSTPIYVEDNESIYPTQTDIKPEFYFVHESNSITGFLEEDFSPWMAH